MGVKANQAHTVYPAVNPCDQADHDFTRLHHDRAAVGYREARLADPKRAALPAGPLLVEEIKTGVYGINRRAGDCFTLRNAQQDFSWNW